MTMHFQKKYYEFEPSTYISRRNMNYIVAKLANEHRGEHINMQYLTKLTTKKKFEFRRTCCSDPSANQTPNISLLSVCHICTPKCEEFNDGREIGQQCLASARVRPRAA